MNFALVEFSVVDDMRRSDADIEAAALCVITQDDTQWGLAVFPRADRSFDGETTGMLANLQAYLATTALQLTSEDPNSSPLDVAERFRQEFGSTLFVSRVAAGAIESGQPVVPEQFEQHRTPIEWPGAA